MQMTLLFVDDQATVLTLLKLVFEDKHTVYTTMSGLEALAIAEMVRIDTAVVDFNMPIMNGLELARQLRVVTPETRIIIYTGSPAEELPAELAEVADEICQKSSSISPLIECVCGKQTTSVYSEVPGPSCEL